MREYWIVDPELERVEIYLLEGSELVKKAEVERGEVASLAVLPGFRISIEKLFA